MAEPLFDIEDPFYESLDAFKEFVLPDIQAMRKLEDKAPLTEQEIIDFYLDEINNRKSEDGCAESD